MPLVIRPFEAPEATPENMKALRNALGLSQAAAALLIRDASQNLVGRWESDAFAKTNPTDPAATRLLRAWLDHCELLAERQRITVKEAAKAYLSGALYAAAERRAARKGEVVTAPEIKAD